MPDMEAFFNTSSGKDADIKAFDDFVTFFHALYQSIGYFQVTAKLKH